MLDEKTRRRENFDERNSEWITLSDSRKWAFPKPWLQVHATFRDGKAVSSSPVLTYGCDLDALIHAISECEDSTALLVGAATLGAFLLCENYDLADAELDELFAFRVADPSSWGWVKAVMDVATGQSGSRSFRDGSA
jgi:hypothetical protein